MNKFLWGMLLGALIGGIGSMMAARSELKTAWDKIIALQQSPDICLKCGGTME